MTDFKSTLNRVSLLTLAMFLSCASLFAQSKVSGVVKDSSGEAVIGASVVVKGTSTGTVTDIDGNYSVNVPANSKTLVFSYLGMRTREVSISGAVVNVTLQEDATDLDEVVVIGYGTMKKRDLTGAVASISGDKLEAVPVSSPAEALTGKIAGVQITTTEGSPDADIKIRVRGGGSITQDNSPLYIVDGFPVNSINDIAASDIATLDVLKDASSTAIYGSRGANGVIIITTKSGSEGKTKIEYNGYAGFKNIAGYLDVLNPYEYVLWQYEYAGNSSKDMSRLFGNFQDIDLYKQMNGTNWQEQVFGQTGWQMNHNISASGGTAKTKYNLSLSRMDDKGIMIEQGFSKTNLAFKLNSELAKTLSLELNFRLADTRIKGAGTSTATSSGGSNSRLKHTVSYRPIMGLASYIDDPDFDDDSDSKSSLYNPVQVTKDDYRRENRQSYSYNMALNWDIIKNLRYRIETGVEYRNTENNRFYGPTTSQSINNGAQLPIVNIRESSYMDLRMANTLTYDLKDIWGGHNFTFLLGNEIISNSSKYIEAESRNFPKNIDPETALSMMGLGTPQPSTTFNYPDERILSFFGRVNYNYLGRYLLSATMRADGSSKFAEGNRWGTFPSVSGAWRISDEEFMSETKEWLSNMKLRASYGMAGNNRIPSDATSLMFKVSSGAKAPYFNETVNPYLVVNGTNLPNPDLKWEVTTTRNLGLDLGFFGSRLNFAVDAYINTTSDLLITATIPSNTGYTSQWQNIGKTSNKGIELTVDGVIIDKKDFQLSASFNIGFNKNKIEELGIESFTQTSGWVTSDGPTGDYLVQKGSPVGLMYGYVTEGMYSFDDFNYNETTKKYTLKEGISSNESMLGGKYFGPGALKLKDISGPNGVPDGKVDENDKTIIGNANPKNTGGFNLSAMFKGFDLSAAFNWVYGNEIYNANKIDFTSSIGSKAYRNMLDIADSANRFTILDSNTGTVVTDPAQLAAMNEGKTMWSPLITRGIFHSWAVEDGSFLRLNTLTLGYTLPKDIIKKAGINRLRVYATAYNVWCWTNYSGYDPEVDTRRSTPMTPGVDYSAYPRSRTFNFGLNLTF